MAELGGHVDKQAPTSDRQFTVIIGDTKVPQTDVYFVDTQTLSIIVPSGLALGTYDVSVITPGGREATLTNGLTVIHGTTSGTICETEAQCVDPCRSVVMCIAGRCVLGDINKDADEDGHFDAVCVGGTDCNDGNPRCTTDCTDEDGDSYCVTDDCDDSPATGSACSVGCLTFFADEDGDLYGAIGRTASGCEAPTGYVENDADCDDDPGACGANCNSSKVEVCDDNNYDEDCNGLSDDSDAGATGKTTYYADNDNDTFGDENDPGTGFCDAPADVVTNHTDCDDDPGMCGAGCNPSQTEVCDANDYDEDCNGLSDDSDAGATGKTTYYADNDNDTFGDENDPGTGFCDAPGDVVTNHTDCDDDPLGCGDECSPAQDEICDGEDNDCNAATVDGADEVTFGDPCDGPDSDDCTEGSTACDSVSLYCTDTTGDDLDLCDGTDNDCDDVVGATDPDCGGSWSDTFDDGDLVGWSVVEGGGWSNEAGELSYSGSTSPPPLIAWEVAGPWTNLTMQADVMIMSSDRQSTWGDLSRLVFRYDGGQNAWCAVFLSDWYTSGGDSFGNGVAFLGIEWWQGGSRQGFQQTEVALVPDDWYPLAVVVTGTTDPTVEAYFDGDGTPTLSWNPTCPAQGEVGISGSETHTHFDNVTVAP
ncbi:hypothetical protein ACFL6C_02230 [Myxococcota bacterium]